MKNSSFFVKSICIVFLMLAVCFSTVACAGPEDRARDLYETAQFEEQQFNPEHAGKLYRQILADYPETEAAELAEKALRKLEQKP